MSFRVTLRPARNRQCVHKLRASQRPHHLIPVPSPPLTPSYSDLIGQGKGTGGVVLHKKTLAFVRTEMRTFRQSFPISYLVLSSPGCQVAGAEVMRSVLQISK